MVFFEKIILYMPGKFWYCEILTLLRPKFGHFCQSNRFLVFFGLHVFFYKQMICLGVRVDFGPKLKKFLRIFLEISVLRRNEQQEMKALFITSTLHLSLGGRVRWKVVKIQFSAKQNQP